MEIIVILVAAIIAFGVGFLGNRWMPEFGIAFIFPGLILVGTTSILAGRREFTLGGLVVGSFIGYWRIASHTALDPLSIVDLMFVSGAFPVFAVLCAIACLKPSNNNLVDIET